MNGHSRCLRPGRLLHRFASAVTLIALTLGSSCLDAHAPDGHSGIDHRLNPDEVGIWARGNQRTIHFGLIGAAIAGALIEGTETRLGLTFWRATEAAALEVATVAVLKRATSRARPSQGNDPNLWFQGARRQSFPSDEVALSAAVTTPFIREYRREHSGVWMLALIPIYVGIARMKSQAHWQTDVLAGLGIGVASGYLASERDRPIFLTISGDGVYIGLRYRW